MVNYFDFFGIAPAPRIDQAELKRKFYANSRTFHPDFHTLADAASQEEALEKSTLNNQAYKTLMNPDQRLKHLLDINGVLGAEGTNQVPQDFLMEIMEVNEALMELEFDDDPAVKTKVNALIDQLENDLEQEVEGLVNHYDQATVSPEELSRLKDYYLKKRYLLRLRGKI
ncbi:Fe-S protein assembly co-chaperone HscB [Lewinella sp. W8]|uniref:Fe-S protein assembly co-chaperone HscB n=1 Tax=Lewinella sp. W8 TaxID=2528208 RepID=UPI001563DF5D|nr:Fe-S protein assembly co-chaperone HscB [Lewinella sp. W8]